MDDRTVPPRVGDRVRLVELPATFDSFPEETRDAFRAALGRTFEVRGIGPYGHLEIELGRELDAVLGGFMNTLWVEPEHLRRVEPAAPAAPPPPSEEVR